MEKFSWAIAFWYYIFPVLLAAGVLGLIARLFAYRLQQRYEKYRLMFDLFFQLNNRLSKLKYDISSLKIIMPYALKYRNMFQEYDDLLNKSASNIREFISISNMLKGIFETSRIKIGIDSIQKDVGLTLDYFMQLSSKQEELKERENKENDKKELINTEIERLLTNITKKFLEIQEFAFKEMKLYKEKKMTKSQIKLISSTLIIIGIIVFLSGIPLLYEYIYSSSINIDIPKEQQKENEKQKPKEQEEKGKTVGDILREQEEKEKTIGEILREQEEEMQLLKRGINLGEHEDLIGFSIFFTIGIIFIWGGLFVSRRKNKDIATALFCIATIVFVNLLHILIKELIYAHYGYDFSVIFIIAVLLIIAVILIATGLFILKRAKEEKKVEK